MRILPALALAVTLAQPGAPAAGEGEKPAEKKGWLSRHQAPDGSWDPAGFDARCEGAEKCTGKGRPEDRVGTTALALLAYLEYGETPDSARYGEEIRRGLGWLLSVQDAEGRFGSKGAPRLALSHAQAAFAMAEAAAAGKDPKYLESARKSLAWLGRIRVPGQGWGAEEGAKETDLPVSAWAALALDAARKGGKIEVDGKAPREFLAWLDGRTDAATGRVDPKGASPPPAALPTATAMAACVRILWGPGPEKDPLLRKGLQVLQASPPSRGAKGEGVDFVYWWFGTLAFRNLGGDAWKSWNESMFGAIVTAQVLDKGRCSYGSWDPVGPSAVEGRVAATAYGVLCLDLYYRSSR